MGPLNPLSGGVLRPLQVMAVHARTPGPLFGEAGPPLATGTRSDWLVSRPSWPWTNGHPDSLLHHEALQDDRGRGHRLDQDLQAGLRDRASAAVPGDVSRRKALVIPRELGLGTARK